MVLSTIGYPPEQLGGTEVYVAALAEGLAAAGHTPTVVVLRPGGLGSPRERREQRGGVVLSRLEVPPEWLAAGPLARDDAIRGRLADTLETACLRASPDIVHLHPLTIRVEAELARRLRGRGIPVVLTYHTPTVSCGRGDLLRRGRVECDGRLDVRRCGACCLQARGAPAPLATAVAGLPGAILRALIRLPLPRRARSLLGVPLQVAALERDWRVLIENTERVVAGSEWVVRLLALNRVASERIALIPHPVPHSIGPRAAAPTGPLRLGFVGRLRREKGAEVLLAALQGLPEDLVLSCEIASPTLASPEPEDRRVQAAWEAIARRDPRVRLIGLLDPSAVQERIGGWDALLVPSLFPETGPLVVLEALAAGVPVIGSRRGGIAERVTEGLTGFLVAPGRADELTELITKLAREPERARALRGRGPLPPDAAELTGRTVELYQVARARCLGGDACSTAPTS